VVVVVAVADYHYPFIVKWPYDLRYCHAFPLFAMLAAPAVLDHHIIGAALKTSVRYTCLDTCLAIAAVPSCPVVIVIVISIYYGSNCVL